MSKKPEALRLADALTHPLVYGDMPIAAKAAAELRRLHSVNADLLEALKNMVMSGDRMAFLQAADAITKAEEA